MASTKLQQAAQQLQKKGNRGDTILAHINPREARLLKRYGGSGTINPKDGLLQFSEGGGGGDGGDGGNGGGSGDSGDSGNAGHGQEAADNASVGSSNSADTGLGAGTASGAVAGTGLSPEALAALPEQSIPGLQQNQLGLLGRALMSGIQTNTNTPGLLGVNSVNQGLAQSAPTGLAGLGFGLETDPVGTISKGVVNSLMTGVPVVGQLNGLAQMANMTGLPQAMGMPNGLPTAGSLASGLVGSVMNGMSTPGQTGLSAGNTGALAGPGAPGAPNNGGWGGYKPWGFQPFPSFPRG